jgi:hypothetical protein
VSKTAGDAKEGSRPEALVYVSEGWDYLSGRTRVFDSN